ncbi:MAG: hypothetical protein GWP10_13675 [Nitrospiraceae bacterium]|nr:hypothetical protein [Nitrospiraceae bacterium]
MKEHLGDRIHPIPDGDMNKLQRLLEKSCFNFIKTKYTLIIFGDNGKPIIIEKVLGRVVVDTLGKVGDDIHITVILDDDGVGYAGLKKGVSDKLKSISKDKSKFTNCFPVFEESKDSFTLNHPRGRGVIEVQLSTVPESLEMQVAKKCIEVRCPTNSKIVEKGPHYALNFLAMEYYDYDKEKLIRETSSLLKDEVWVKDVEDRVR